MMSLRQTAVGGAKWTTFSAIYAASVQFIQVAILAHYLNKADFGLMALALIVIGISQIFIDMGISQAIIHKQSISSLQLSSLFWINILMGTIIFFVIFFLAPFISVFYSNNELTNIIRWISINFLILPLGQQYDALLQKNFEFKKLSFRDILSKTLALVVGVILAIYGYGVYALVFANISYSFLSTLLLIISGWRYHNIEFRFSLQSIKNGGFLSFGLFQIGEKTVNYFCSQFDTIIIGKLLGMETLGIYNVAKTLAFRPFQILNPIITKVSFPIMAYAQNEIVKVSRIYLKMVNFLSSTNAPVYVLMIILAKPLVIVMFGSKWLDAVPILQLLSVCAFLISIISPVGALQLALGRADLGFYWNLVILFLIPITVWLGSYFGLIGVALCFTILRLLLLFPCWKYLIFPLCKIKFKDFIKQSMLPVFYACLSGIIPFILLELFNFNVVIEIIFSFFIYFILYYVVNRIYNKELVLEIKNFVLVK